MFLMSPHFNKPFDPPSPSIFFLSVYISNRIHPPYADIYDR